ncbi:MAG: recombinase family protein [Eggerthellaceae bacterium]|nr:recombinase family protein [Eggerthellaceae bacterium]
MKTAVIYARYSSDKQREASIEDQLRVCRDFCAREGIQIVREYADHALSGKTDQRPQFREMIDNAPESDIVLVYMFDRFSRSRYDSIVYKKALKDCGVRVVSAQEAVQDTPEGNLQESMLEVLSEYYVADMARKIRRGMEGNALKARNNGYKLFGYDTDPDTHRYIINDAEAAAVVEIFDRHLAGDSIYSIAREMRGRGWTTSKGTPVDYNWVQRILKRRAYTGIYSWDGIEVEGGMPVIIPKEKFERASKVAKKKPRAGEVWSDYKLTGKLFCGFCGAPMHGYGGTSKTGKRYYYYGCKERGGCKRKGIHRDLVENALADAVLQIASDEQKMRRLAKRVVESYDMENDAQNELESCDERIAGLEAEQHRLTRAAMKGFVTDEMVERNEQIKEQLETLHAQRGILASQVVELTEDDIVEFLLHGFDRSDEDFIFNGFVNKVWLFEDYLVACFNFRGDDDDLECVHVTLENGIKNDPNLTCGFGSVLSGVPCGACREPAIIVLPHGFGLVIPLSA